MIYGTVWDIGCIIASLVAIIGPMLLVGWYFKAAKEKIKKLHEGK